MKTKRTEPSGEGTATAGAAGFAFVRPGAEALAELRIVGRSPE